MPKCNQCDGPAIYAIGDQQIPLCLHCWAIHQSVIDRQLAALARQEHRPQSVAAAAPIQPSHWQASGRARSLR